VNVSRAVEVLDAVLARWSPAVRVLPNLVPAIPVDLARAGLAVARAVDAALESLIAEPRPAGGDRDERPGPVTLPADVVTSADVVNATALGFVAVSRVVADLVRPPYRRPNGRKPRAGNGSRSEPDGPGLTTSNSTATQDGPA
jgi:hypothetical protein